MKFTEWAELKQDKVGEPDAKEFQYIGCVLHAASQKELIRAGQKFMFESTASLIPPHWAGKAHHMTVKFSPTIKDMTALQAKFGKPNMITIEAFAYDDKCLAAIVKSPIPSVQAIPHITIAHSPDVPAIYANDMIKDRSRWKRYLEIDELYTYLLAVRNDNSVWPNVVGQLASPSALIK